MCESSRKVRARLTTREGKPVFVRPVDEEDMPRLRAFAKELSEESRRVFTPHSYDETTLREVVERARAGKDRVYVALVEGRVVG